MKVAVNKKELITYLSEFATDKRFEQFKEVIQYRTRYITVAIEDVYQSQNASAVLRTCECLGIQDIHVIENKNKYTLNPDVALGASKWINIIKHNQKKNNSLQTISYLKENGYRIVATTPHKNECSLEEFNIENGRFALFFGTEMNGLTCDVIDNADEYLKIPMFGFTESFNISVSAAIILHHLTLRLRNSNIPWQLSDEEKDDILLNWLQQSIKKADRIIYEFYKK
ncbi:MAG: RNA methyltransferase [Bacteroidales bacterium]|nr:RNA methyltransferase [Bacteroidales bacterium]